MVLELFFFKIVLRRYLYGTRLTGGGGGVVDSHIKIAAVLVANFDKPPFELPRSFFFNVVWNVFHL